MSLYAGLREFATFLGKGSEKYAGAAENRCGKARSVCSIGFLVG